MEPAISPPCAVGLCRDAAVRQTPFTDAQRVVRDRLESYHPNKADRAEKDQAQNNRH